MTEEAMQEAIGSDAREDERLIPFTIDGKHAAYRRKAILGFHPAGGSAGGTVLLLSGGVSNLIVDQPPDDVARLMTSPQSGLEVSTRAEAPR